MAPSHLAKAVCTFFCRLPKRRRRIWAQSLKNTQKRIARKKKKGCPARGGRPALAVYASWPSTERRAQTKKKDQKTSTRKCKPLLERKSSDSCTGLDLHGVSHTVWSSSQRCTGVKLTSLGQPSHLRTASSRWPVTPHSPAGSARELRCLSSLTPEAAAAAESLTRPSLTHHHPARSPASPEQCPGTPGR